jgi:hypothetical protein
VIGRRSGLGPLGWTALAVFAVIYAHLILELAAALLLVALAVRLLAGARAGARGPRSLGSEPPAWQRRPALQARRRRGDGDDPASRVSSKR